MMRKNQLRQQANRFLTQDSRGSHRDKLFRHFVIHKLIDSLFSISDVPPKWHALNEKHIHQLVNFWQRKKIKPATIMKYMTVIRYFLKAIDHHIPDIGNTNLGLSRKHPPNINLSVSLKDLQQISDPLTRIVLNLIAYFGLTFSEAIQLLPGVHIQEYSLWLTREMTSNSQDRIIPIRTDFQKSIIQEFFSLSKDEKNLKDSFGYDAIRHAYRRNLINNRLSVKKCYRYLYARMLNEQLSPILGHYELSLLIMREMGLQSRTTLWGYLRE